MIYLFFFLKFKSQLRRTRPDNVRLLDESLIRSINDAGGKVTGNRSVISAVFNSNAIGFWLDIYILIENLKREIETSNNFFGYSLVIYDELPNTPEKLCGFLANHNGVFINEKLADNFIPYSNLEKSSEWLREKDSSKYNCGGFCRIKELKSFKNAGKVDSEIQNEIIKIFKNEEEKNILVLGQPHIRIRPAIYSYGAKLNKDFPPLTICFRSVGIGVFVDVWSSTIRSLFEKEISNNKLTEEIDNLWELLFRERLRDEVSNYAVRCLNRFLYLIFEYYIYAALKKKRVPVLVLENVHIAGNALTEMLFNALNEVEKKNRVSLVILGMGEDDIQNEKLHHWEYIFRKIKKIEIKNQQEIIFPKLSVELWEMIYAVSLFSSYFSPELTQRILEENGLNPVMIKRAFSILYNLGIIDNLYEPRIVNRFYEEKAKEILGNSVGKINSLVCAQILKWAEKRIINPCFRMLVIIFDLQGSKQIDDNLILKSILSDIINETITGIETAVKTGLFDEITGKKAQVIKYIINTSKVLHTGDENDIENKFIISSNEDIISESNNFQFLKTQIIVNLCAYYLGRHDVKQSTSGAKDAIFLSQGRNDFCLPQSYRMYALVCLSKQHITETIEYLGFAISNAEKTNNFHEASISSYYLAVSYFLYGDIYNSSKFAGKSIRQSLGAGRTEWADRSRFLEGRIEFELGNYKRALDIFKTLRKEPFGKFTDEKDSLLAAWIFRCNNYLNDVINENLNRLNRDTDLFEIEAAYLSRNYKKVIELSNLYKNPFLEETFLFTEQVDWQSGFEQCEHLFFSNGEIEDRLNCMFQSLALSNLPEENGDDALVKIQRILRDEKLCEMDPWDAFYFYARYRILENTSCEDVVDMSTTVSIAFKRLQRRAGRIEDIETRRRYLNGARWNRELSLAAKEFKLI